MMQQSEHMTEVVEDGESKMSIAELEKAHQDIMTSRQATPGHEHDVATANAKMALNHEMQKYINDQEAKYQNYRGVGITDYRGNDNAFK